MKTELTNHDRWEISIEPENEMEECAFEYLASRPKNQLIIRITRLGVFSRTEEEDK